MPTENRSSSNHGTRTFTLDSLTAALEQVQAFHEISADLIAENVFGQPAQQGQGEPVAFEIEVSGYTTLLARTHNKADATAAHYRALGHMVDIRPLGPLADRAEVERLRQKVSDLTVSGHQEYMRCEKMRAQLAEAQALLRDVLADVEEIFPTGKTANKVRSYLSASAEPSAPVEVNEQPEFVKTITSKLQRFLDCAEDGQGADIGREWFDVLTKLGLLRRIQRSPAWWEVTEQGDALLARAALARKP